MKKVLTIVLAGVSTLALAQKKIDLSRSIDDDGKKLSISVHGTVDGKRIDYNRTFSVANLSKQERDNFADGILDSLGAGNITLPAPPRTPRAPQSPKPPVHFSADGSDNDAPAIVWVEETTNIIENTKPFGKEIKYNSASGELFMRYHFTKNSEEFIYEKTVNASEKSGKQRQNMILDFEKEIGLPGNLIQ